MKMIKRTLMAIAVVALLASSVYAAISDDSIYYLQFDKSFAVKVDGVDQPTIRWPYTISYNALTVCTIPVKMHVGMYVQIENCTDKKIILEQVNCSTIGKGNGDFPCYVGCVDLNVRANFNVKMGSSLHTDGNMIKGNGGDWSAYYDNGVDTVAGDGDYHGVKLCVKAWKSQILKATPGDEVTVGTVDVTVKPN
jgi:hypothetical protein